MIQRFNNDMPQRFVACLDVLGFSAALGRDPLFLAEAYGAAVRLAGLIRDDVEIYPHIFEIATFSDSIFIFTRDDSQDSFTEICDACVTIYRIFLTRNLALRGGISRGGAIANPENRIYLGQAIVDAWLIEQSLDLTGIVLARGLEGAGTAAAVATFRDRQTDALWSEPRRVPTFTVPLARGEVTDIAAFRRLRAIAGPDFSQRYQNSEPVIAAMFGFDFQTFQTSLNTID